MSEWAVDGYTEVRELGAGAQGRVVLARHDESGTPVAIKYLTGETERERLRHEARMLGRADSPHIARLHRLVEGPDGAAIIMEAVDGVSLKEVLGRHGALGPEASLAVLKGSLLGLAAAHALGVVHRDYKPANVVVPADGLSRLVDFGIATPAGQEAGGAGTPYYMAPEQWDRHTATPATDVYAATCVFVECATGRRPFTGTRAALMLAHRTGEIPVETVPEPLRPLVARGMAKSPADRPAAASAFVEELEALAVRAYGPDWEHTGVRTLAAAAASLAALFPIAATLLPGAQTAGQATADGAGHAVGEAVAHGAGEAVAQGAGQAIADGAGHTVGEAVAHGAGEAVAQGAGQATAGGAGHTAGEAVAHGAGEAAGQGAGQAVSGGAGKAAAAKAGAGGLKTALGIGAAACGTVVAVGGGALIAMQPGDEDPARPQAGRSVSASPSRTATVASVTHCDRTGPGGNPMQETPGETRVQIPASVRLPQNTGVFHIGGQYLIGPTGTECGGSVGAASGVNQVGDERTGVVRHGWQGSVGGIAMVYCSYFPDSPEAAEQREMGEVCESALGSPRRLPTGGPLRAVIGTETPLGERPPSPYVSVVLATVGDEGAPGTLTCVMPWERADVCTAALTYAFVRTAEATGTPPDVQDQAVRTIADVVKTARR
ncbi:serine/threonine-protein kinase [Actinomadura sp. WMMB 499]|uniref:serine/threonine-protein kinase n=1 Tax=Actinomadura sp. WMMB 499 TaxID=1219491 RepID=UPI001C3F79E1|nr:serine/threonine-protein kinase [Actinomadura sp. WMMB 499]